MVLGCKSRGGPRQLQDVAPHTSNNTRFSKDTRKIGRLYGHPRKIVAGGRGEQGELTGGGGEEEERREGREARKGGKGGKQGRKGSEERREGRGARKGGKGS